MSDWTILERLVAQIDSRKTADPAISYVASLLKAPVKKSAQKLAEEGAELAIAAVSEGKEAATSEAADLLFHLLVLCARLEIRFDEVLAELARREGTPGLQEKASRSDP